MCQAAAGSMAARVGMAAVVAVLGLELRLALAGLAVVAVALLARPPRWIWVYLDLWRRWCGVHRA